MDEMFKIKAENGKELLACPTERNLQLYPALPKQQSLSCLISVHCRVLPP